MKKFCFIDLETTGLYPQSCEILEFAMIITDNKLNELEVYHTPVYQSKYILDGMSHWAEQTHSASGLLDEVRKSDVTVKKLEQNVLDILERHFTGIERPVIAGSSVHFDKGFIAAHLPNVNKRLHHRLIDASSFMEALKIYHGLEPSRNKNVAHRALADIRDSIKYLKGYLERFK